MKRLGLLFLTLCLAAVGAYAETEGLHIPLETLNENVAFVFCQSGDTRMEVLARRNAQGEVKLAFNTCQVCMGSPYAFFLQKGRMLECQNCHNSFELDILGEENSMWCMPWTISDFVLTDTEAVISQKVLDEAAPAFARWKKGI